MTTHNGWNKIPPMILTHESMKEPEAFVTILKELAFDLLTKKLLFCKLQICQF
jgi:hypothetical protein